MANNDEISFYSRDTYFKKETVKALLAPNFRGIFAKMK